MAPKFQSAALALLLLQQLRKLEHNSRLVRAALKFLLGVLAQTLKLEHKLEHKHNSRRAGMALKFQSEALALRLQPLERVELLIAQMASPLILALQDRVPPHLLEVPTLALLVAQALFMIRGLNLVNPALLLTVLMAL